MTKQSIKELLDEKFEKYNQIGYIDDDPVSIPHRFSEKQDIEIAGLFAALLAWGKRKTILNKCTDLMNRMDNQPFRYIKDGTENDLKSLLTFKHRTFNDFDLLVVINFLREHYKQSNSLEDAFLLTTSPTASMKNKLIAFRNHFANHCNTDCRTLKHISTPQKNSACKRLNMFLRWMVRKDQHGVDFGIWRRIQPSELIIPCDVHVITSARKLGFTQLDKPTWKMAEEITSQLKKFDNDDPIKYDFALFGMGIENYFKLYL